jgi:hypothetical protein
MSVFDDGRRGDRTPRPPTETDHDIAARVRDLENKTLVIAGPNLDNGKLGTLRRDFDEDRKARSRVGGWVAGVAVTALLTSAGAAWTVAREDGAEERTIEYLRDELAALRGVVDRITSEAATLRLEVATLRATMPPARRTRDGDQP